MILYKKRLIIAALLLAGCSNDMSAAGTKESLNQRYSGHPARDFFASYGQPVGKAEATDDGKRYHWSSIRPGSAIAQPMTYDIAPNGVAIPLAPSAGASEQICQLDIRTDAREVIRHISITRDTPGKMSNSYCGEIFSVK